MCEKRVQRGRRQGEWGGEVEIVSKGIVVKQEVEVGSTGRREGETEVGVSVGGKGRRDKSEI